MLEKHPEARDDDHLLMFYVWIYQDGGIHTKKFGQVAQAILRGELVSPMAVSRARRKIQELCPQLRGKEYANRHREATRMREAISQGKLFT